MDPEKKQIEKISFSNEQESKSEIVKDDIIKFDIEELKEISIDLTKLWKSIT